MEYSGSSPVAWIDTASAASPSRASTSASRTPSHVTPPTAPSFHAVPLTVMDCWDAKNERPLPVHSCDAVTRVTGSRRRSAYDRDSASASARGSDRPVPKTRSRQASRSIVGVTVWLRTNSRDWSVRKRFGSTESHRVSALVVKSVNHSGGNGLRIDGAPADDGRAGAAATAPMAAPATAPVLSRDRRERLVVIPSH